MQRLLLTATIVFCTPALVRCVEPPERLTSLLERHCFECHDGADASGGLNLATLAFDLAERTNRDRWIQIHDRIRKREMPPQGKELGDEQRLSLLRAFEKQLVAADRADVLADGRGPMRRLTREEFEQNLREILDLPDLDIRDMLPPDRESHGFNKTAAVLDMSRIQLVAYLDAIDAALRQAMATGPHPPSVTQYRAVSRDLFPGHVTFGERPAMFFAKDNKALSNEEVDRLAKDESVELALFRSAHWPYYGYPRRFVAKLPGRYRVRFSARAVLQLPDYQIKPAERPIPMTFRARKPSGPDVSGDVRATGGIMDVLPEKKVFETTIRLLPTETFEYSLLGLPVPLARNVDGGPPTYRYPPFPEGGQPGVAFQWLEVVGPLAPDEWPPASHKILFDNLGTEPKSSNPPDDARRLLRRFVERASREPVDEKVMTRLERLVLARLENGRSFADALLAGYKAFLASGRFLYLRDPTDRQTRTLQQYAVASRLSHFLVNSRPDRALIALAAERKLLEPDVLARETDRLIASPGFQRFVDNFTNYWLDLRHMKRDEPDHRLYPEYRFDNYVIESMEREARTFFAAMIRENLPAAVVIDADFAYLNDRLSRHYGLAPLIGSSLRKVSLPPDSPFGGLMTHAAVLKLTSSGSSTSPVIRGAWVMERLLGQPPPPPPASVPAVEPDLRGAKTIRQLLAQHAASESCASCHARFDPVGVALENFDIQGAWRTHYRSLKDAHAEGQATASKELKAPLEQTTSPSREDEKLRPVRGIDRAGHDFAYDVAQRVDPTGQLQDGRRFANVRELKSLLLADRRQLARNLLQQFIVYSTGTPVRFSDREVVEAILDGCRGDDYRVRDLVHGLVQSRIFLGEVE